MRRRGSSWAAVLAIAISAGIPIIGSRTLRGQQASTPTPPRDPVAEAQAVRKVPVDRPEQRPNEHDRSGLFDPQRVPPSSPALDAQPEQGRTVGFDFGRDAFDARRPMQPFEGIMQMDVANKPVAMSSQLALLARRYDLNPRFEPEARMSRGKPLAVGPTAKLASGLDG